MKKPEKRKVRIPSSEHVRSLNLGALANFHQDLGHNICWDEWEAYHNWDIKENYIRKPNRENLWEIINSIDYSVEDYELRADNGDYAPNEREKTLIVDYVAGFLVEIVEELSKKLKQERE